MRIAIRPEASGSSREKPFDDVYFHSVVEKLHLRENGATEVTCARYAGSIVLEKDD